MGFPRHHWKTNKPSHEPVSAAIVDESYDNYDVAEIELLLSLKRGRNASKLASEIIYPRQPVKVFTDAEKRALEADMKKRGDL